jgi:hypothetical protein
MAESYPHAKNSRPLKSEVKTHLPHPGLRVRAHINYVACDVRFDMLFKNLTRTQTKNQEPFLVLRKREFHVWFVFPDLRTGVKQGQ